MKSISDFSISCTAAQTKKALELGAPIDLESEYYHPTEHDVKLDSPIPCKAFTTGYHYAKCPTAEQMIGFLESQGMNISVIYIRSLDVWDSYIDGEEYIDLESGDYESRQEATLAAIDAALEHLIQNKKQTHLTKTIMNYPINRKCIIRCTNAGVFYATLTEFDNTTNTAVLADCRRIWYWSGAASLSQLATEGVKNPRECKFTVVVPSMVVTEVIEIIPCTDEAIENINAVSVWKM